MYGNPERAGPQMVTCGGDYAEYTGHQGDVVVCAALTAVGSRTQPPLFRRNDR